jgi:hypothetical protein
MFRFQANCLPLLIGSLPLRNHEEATRLILRSTPDIPIWPQLPSYKEEGMLLQFLPGFPGKTDSAGKVFINTASAGFSSELLAFYEDYIAVTEGNADLGTSRFALTPETARGFFTFLQQIGFAQVPPTALKGQITGPITFCMAIADESGRVIFYNSQLKDAAIKMIAQKARWQIRRMAEICKTTLIFFDEPGLAGFGSSAFITISPDEVKECLDEVFAAVHAENGLAGVHVCANTEWPVVFDTQVDVVSCDTYSYFEKLLLYPERLMEFFNRGGIFASGIIPTIPEFLDVETAETLTSRWFEQKSKLQDIGVSEDRIFSQTLITPSCGTGSISMEYTKKVLELTENVSKKIREMKE